MYNWEFYDVETQNKETEEIIKIENYTTLEEAKEYIKRMEGNKSLDYNEKLLLVKRVYNIDRDLIYEEILEEVK